MMTTRNLSVTSEVMHALSNRSFAAGVAFAVGVLYAWQSSSAA